MSLVTRPITPEVLERVMKLREGPLHPAILKVKEEIKGRTRALELRSSVPGALTPNEIEEEVEEITRLRIHLDGLYGQWIDGTL